MGDYQSLDLSELCNVGTVYLPSEWRHSGGEYDSLPFDNELPPDR